MGSDFRGISKELKRKRQTECERQTGGRAIVKGMQPDRKIRKR